MVVPVMMIKLRVEGFEGPFLFVIRLTTKGRHAIDELIATKRPFQFRQGFDERQLALHKRGEDMARKLASWK